MIGRFKNLVATLATVVVAIGVTASPAAAEAPSPGVPTISNVSYGSAHVRAEITQNGSGFTLYSIQYSTDDATWTTATQGFFSAPITIPAEVEITGLAAATTYYVRMTATNFVDPEVASPTPDPEFTTLEADPPVVLATDNVSELEYTTAKVGGEVSRPAGDDAALDVQCNFEYVTDAQFSGTGFDGATKVPCGGENPIHKVGSSAVAGELNGLSPATEYHLRLSGTNAGGTDSIVASSTFTTAGPVPTPTVLATNVSGFEYTTAKVNGEISRPAGADSAIDVGCNFEYVTEAQFGGTGFEGAAQVPCGDGTPIKKAGASAVSAELTGLSPATEYHLRLSGTNAGGTDTKAASSTFTTAGPVPAPKVLSVANATDVGYGVATVSGEVERPAGADAALDTECVFQYSSIANYIGNETDRLVIGATGGTFVLIFEGVESSPIAFDAAPATVGDALEAYAGIGAGNVSVSGGPGDEKHAHPYVITFVGALANTDVPDVGQNGTNLTGPAIEASLNTIVQGHPEGFQNAGQVPCEPENPIHKSGPDKVGANILGGLDPGTEYHLRLLVTNAGGSDAKAAANFITKANPPGPSVSIDPVTVITGTSAVITGEVNPNGTEAPFEGEYSFQCSPECGVVQGRFFREELDGNPKEVSAEFIGLEPNKTYQVKLVAYNFYGGSDEVESETFKTPLALPTAQTRYGTEVKAHSATLQGRVNPHNSPVTYQFEWGTDQTYGNAAPAPPASLEKIDDFAHPVELEITGLEEGTAYHFRVSATNTDTGETTHGEDHIFRTPPFSSCPNEVARAENKSTNLPACRAYEMVTPIEKSGNDAGFPSGGNYSHSSTDGNAVVYHTRGTLEGVVKSGLQLYTLSHRSSDGWDAGPGIPRGDQERIDALLYNANTALYSPDLERVFWSSEFPWIQEVPAFNTLGGTGGVFRGYADESDPVEWLSRPEVGNPQPPFGGMTRPFTVGGSPDLDTVYFWGTQSILPGDETRQANGAWGLYEISDGVLEHADTLPGGDLPPGGSAPPNIGSGQLGRNAFEWNAEVGKNQVTPDGSTLFFVTPDPSVGGPSELYVRHDGHSTLVSRMQDGKPAPNGISVNAVNPEGSSTQRLFVTPDGKTAYFGSPDALTADAPSGSAIKAYRYDIESDVVSYLPGVGNATVVASSDDGERFLYEQGRIMLWDHGAIKIVAPAGGHAMPARATADGSAFVFLATALPNFNSGAPFNPEVYRYDTDEELLGCISCPPDSTFASNPAGFGNTNNTLNTNPLMSPDADQVFFDTKDPLIPRDINGVSDVYEWSPSGPALISSGRNQYDSVILSSSPSGDDVFFATKEGIGENDEDGLYDVYDARVGGGFRNKPKVIPCSGSDLCHGAPQEVPAQSSGGSKAFEIPPTPKFRAVPGKVADGKLKLTVTAPIAATVSASGKGLRSTRHVNSKPGTFKLEIPMKPTLKRTIRRKKETRVKVHLHYSPDTGTPSSADLVLSVKG